MVLESIINPMKAERKPWEMLFIGFVYSSVAVFLSLWIFEQYASLVMVFLTVIACTPLMYNTIKVEEEKDLNINKEFTLLKEHSRALSFFMFLFVGITLSYAFWYTLLPMNVTGNLFSIQTETIANINNQVTGLNIQSLGVLGRIFSNNMKVLVFCLLFSFIYGIGAIFILTWNASVIGAAIGNFIRSNLAQYSNLVGLMKVGGYLQISSLGIMRYALHGIPEILAYFVAGLAGGIISVAVIRHDFGTKRFEKILLDSSDLIILSLVILLIAALLEVYVTPLLF
jgi:uncharacterized membrane protein SpoIIM required for sporulation